jgi:hypothetical protein
MPRSRVACFALTILLISTLPALAAEGAIPIFEPITIVEPGRYVVTRNISSSSPIITINSHRVDIDLNGFELTGGTTAPVITGSTVQDVRIHDGSVVAGNPGIYFEISGQITIENTAVRGSGGIGIHLNGSEYTVRRCTIAAGLQAIHAVAAFGTPGIIAENVIKECGTSAATTECVLVQGGYGVTIRDNKLVGLAYGDAGIRLNSSNSSSISGNSFYDFGGDEIDIAIQVQDSWNVSVEANTGGVPIVLEGSSNSIISNNQVVAITIDSNSHANTILRNTTMSGGGYWGVEVEGDRNLIEANINDHGYGIWFSSTAEGNVYAGNVARGGAGSGCTGTATANFCDEGTGNTSNGDNYMPGNM